MAYARVVVGGFVFMIGILTLVRTVFENMSSLSSSPLQLLDFSKMPDVAIVIVLEALITAAGVVILCTSKKSPQPHKTD